LTVTGFSDNLRAMARITINLEPLAGLYRDGVDRARAVIKNALACEVAGADSVLISLDGDPAKRKVISSLIDTLDIGLTIKTAMDGKSLESVIDLRPAMAMIPFQAERTEGLATTITNLQVENILVALEIPLELERVKDAARLKCDYVILNCEPFCSAKTVNTQLEELNRISKLAALASRLTMGTIALGDFSIGHLGRMKSGLNVEEYILGVPFFSDALVHGYSRALEIVRFALT